MAKIEQVELQVEDNAIHCSGCESRIEQILKRLPGVARVNADHHNQKVGLALDTAKTPLDEVKQKLEFAGYPTG